jgi:hypothetical protein
VILRVVLGFDVKADSIPMQEELLTFESVVEAESVQGVDGVEVEWYNG